MPRVWVCPSARDGGIERETRLVTRNFRSAVVITLTLICARSQNLDLVVDVQHPTPLANLMMNTVLLHLLGV